MTCLIPLYPEWDIGVMYRVCWEGVFTFSDDWDIDLDMAGMEGSECFTRLSFWLGAEAE